MSFLSTKSYDASLDANRSVEVNPIDQRFMTERPVTGALVTNTTAYKYINMNGYRHLGIQAINTIGSDSITITVEASVQDDGTAPASCDYLDKTNDWFGVASWVSTDFVETVSNIAVTWVRICYITSNGGGGSSLSLYVKRMY